MAAGPAPGLGMVHPTTGSTALEERTAEKCDSTVSPAVLPLLCFGHRILKSACDGQCFPLSVMATNTVWVTRMLKRTKDKVEDALPDLGEEQAGQQAQLQAEALGTFAPALCRKTTTISAWSPDSISSITTDSQN